MSGQVRHTHWYNSGADVMGVITFFCVVVLASFLVSVTNYPDQSTLKKEGLMWLPVQGYSPPWHQKLEVTKHIIYAVRKQRVVAYWTYWVQLAFLFLFFVVQDPNPQNGVTHFIMDLSTSIFLINIFPHKHGQKIIFIKTIRGKCAWKFVS